MSIFESNVVETASELST